MQIDAHKVKYEKEDAAAFSVLQKIILFNMSFAKLNCPFFINRHLEITQKSDIAEPWTGEL